ncbi:unnamed protein product [Paramecium primaurelia]|uniref:Uncharacterized protein n=1 Tax=Paramecium primaurelia TaxID=5886 RepID=A0A8S1QRV7_PARPR|nr:unnamed protein product [Paramecium primaurelia]
MFNNFNEGCLEQIDEKCLICQEGWIQDEFLENCHPICGDGIIQGQEQCDDGNLISTDLCYLCKYSCIQFCSICQFGICLQCQDGFIINAKFNCDPLCGDGNLIPYSTEQCELTVNGGQDNCLECRFIPIEYCKTSYFSFCLECEVGFYIYENKCFPYCGDKFILEQYEDCDEDNQQPHDGCFNCKFQCIEDCNRCEKGQCIQKCEDGYEFVNNICLSVCGDQIITKEEDCDDGNLQPYDGCFECKFQCIEDCNRCEKGQCIQKCEDGYEFVNNICLSVCGDQIITKEEDCDDGNLQPYDGCFNCKYSCPENCFDCYQGTCLECNYQYQLLISNQCKKQLTCGDGYLQVQEDCDDGNYQAVQAYKYLFVNMLEQQFQNQSKWKLHKILLGKVRFIICNMIKQMIKK